MTPILLFYFLLYFTVAESTPWEDMDKMLKSHVRRPPLDYKKPLKIYVGMFLESLGKFKESEMVSNSSRIP